MNLDRKGTSMAPCQNGRQATNHSYIEPAEPWKIQCESRSDEQRLTALLSLGQLIPLINGPSCRK